MCAYHRNMKTRNGGPAPRRTPTPRPVASEVVVADPAPRPAGDDDDEIRYSLSALGEAVVSERRGRFRGFGPCVAVA